MKVKRLLFAIVLVLSLILLSALGQDTTITYWATNEGPSLDFDQQVLGQALAEFTTQTGIEVDFKVIPWDSLYNNILTAVTSGEGPDVLNIGNTWSASLQATGAFLPFDAEAMQAIGGEDKFLEAPLESAGMPGMTPTAVPLYSNANGPLFYNKKLFEEAGIESPPETWDELIEAGQKLAKDTDGDGAIDQWGLAIAGGSIGDNIHRAFVLSQQQGGSLFNEQGEPTFASPENVRAFKQYVDLMAEHEIVAPQVAEYNGSQAVSDFANSKAAMIFGPSRLMVNLEQLGMSEDDYGVALAPLPDPLPEGGRDIMAFVSGTNITIFNNTENREAALALVEFLTSPEQQVKLVSQYNSLPVVKEALDAPALQGEKLDVFRQILTNHAKPMPQVPQEAQMETLLGGALKSLFAQAATTGTVTEEDVRSALEAANQQMQAAGGQ